MHLNQAVARKIKLLAGSVGTDGGKKLLKSGASDGDIDAREGGAEDF